ISGHHSARRVTAAEKNSYCQCSSGPSKVSRAILFVIQEARSLNSDQQTKRRDDWKNSVDALRRNERHQHEADDAPTNEPKRLGRNFFAFAAALQTGRLYDVKFAGAMI